MRTLILSLCLSLTAFACQAEAFRHYAVPAMSEVQRLEDVRPTDGVEGGTVGIVVARDEFEPGAFVVCAEKDLGKVSFSIGEMTDEQGRKFPREDLDLRLVKVWYQNLNGWFGYFADKGQKLCPELLVHDEDLIRVDTAKQANYARLVGKDGKVRERWLNAPRQFESRPLPGTGSKVTWFEYMREDFRDAKTMQPVTLAKDVCRCFFLTAHTRKDTPAGLYRGKVEISGGDGRRIGSIPVAIRVLDFVLPQPKCYQAPEKDFLVSSYSYLSLDEIARVNGFDYERAYRQQVAVFRNAVEHNQPIQWLDGSMNNKVYLSRKAIAEAGGRTDVYLGGAFPLIKSWTDRSQGDLPQRIADESDRRYGHRNVYIGYGDEVGHDWLAQARPVYEEFQKLGMKFIIAGNDCVFNAVGYLYDWFNAADEPTEQKTARKWNAIQNNNRVAWYACQHVGPENPAFNRRQNGLGAWLSGYTALCNYAHHLGPYNDDGDLYKPMVNAYGTGDGVLDTLQWEGFREGIDDIRYATLMTALARKAQSSADVKVRHLGGEAMLYLAKTDANSYDADCVRLDMIVRIERLRAAVGDIDFTSDVFNDPAAAKPGAVRAEANLKAALEKAVVGFASAKTAGASNVVHKAVAEAYRHYLREEEGGDYLMRNGLPAAAIGYYNYLPEKQQAAREAIWRRLLGKPGSILDGDSAWNLVGLRDELLGPDFERYFFGTLKPNDTNRWQKAVGAVLSKLGKGSALVNAGRYDTLVAVYGRVAPLAEKWQVPLDAAVAKNLCAAYCRGGDARGISEVVKRSSANPKVTVADRYYLAIADALGAARQDERRVRELVGRVSEDAAFTELAPKARADVLCSLGSALNGAGCEAAVRALDECRRALYKPVPKRRYSVAYSETPVDGISGWERLPGEVVTLDRAFGGNMEFLVTDVASGDRGKVGTEKDGFKPPRMKIVADRAGLHIFVAVDDPKAKKIELGLCSAGSFETYLAPGANTPYVCCINDPARNNPSFFNTSYDTFGTRRLAAEDYGRLTHMRTSFGAGGFVCHAFYSWANWPGRVPTNGAVWDFENVYWNRAGGFCWNGLETVHGRSTWGELAFSLTDAQRAQILRPLIGMAYGAYRFAKHRGNGIEGMVARWADPVTGDAVFYEERLKPLVGELDALMTRVTVEMDDKTVLELAETAMPRWFDVMFEVQCRRAAYLRERLLK